jgi:microcystin-dependent protein
MSTPFISEIRMFGFAFAPKTWAFCDGQTVPIPQNTALFSLLGTTYGGDGITTFGLPNLMGKVPVAFGQGQQSEYVQGESGGESTVTLFEKEMPIHAHGLTVSADPATEREPVGQNFAAGVGVNYWSTQNASGTLDPQALSSTGTGGWHNNLQPYLTVNFCIALQGAFPARG